MIHSEISEWWDDSGHHHEGHPSDDELLHEAVQVTGHVWDSEGNNVYWTSFSDDGWEPDEWEEDVQDAYAGYIGGEQ